MKALFRSKWPATQAETSGAYSDSPVMASRVDSSRWLVTIQKLQDDCTGQ